MTIFFTSDLHLGHRNVIPYCNRPFADVGEMDTHIGDQWLARVKRTDQVYVLGDFSFHDHHDTAKILRYLPGQKFLVQGNHDHRQVRNLTEWAWVKPLYELKIKGDDRIEHPIVLCHYPLETWNRSHKGSWHLHGHCHGDLDRRGNRLDVGFDAWGRTPISLDEIVEEMTQGPEFRPTMHHKPRQI